MAGMALFLTNNLIGGWYADPLQMLILVGGVGLGMWEIVRKAPVCDELL
jgi:hypothetical protein